MNSGGIMKQFKYIPFLIAIGILVLLSGCISSQEAIKPIIQVSPTPTLTISPPPIVSNVDTQISQSIEQNKINELENKINSMQQQIKELQTSIDVLGLPKPSNKNLIPNVPFRIQVMFAKMQSPTTWTFKENGQLEICCDEKMQVEHGGYILLSNNTIRMTSSDYDFYGLVLYDDYATAIYENGWIAWVKKYQLIPPNFNTITGKYELN